MRGLRYSFIAGAATLFGGIYFREKFTMSSYMMPSGRLTPPPGTSEEYNLIGSVDSFGENSIKSFKFSNKNYKLRLPKAEIVFVRKNEIRCYDQRNKIPKYVIEYITANDRQSDNYLALSKKQFEEDISVPELYRSTVEDYRGSFYDKGHMARANNHRHDREAWGSTYLLSNIAPMIPSFNKGIWSKLERHVDHFVNKYNSVLVWTGSLFVPRQDPDGKKRVSYEVIGDNVAVPTHFFKVILCIDEDDNIVVMESYLMEHTGDIDKNKILNEFFKDKADIEKVAGYLIFETLPTSKLKTVNSKRINRSKL